MNLPPFLQASPRGVFLSVKLQPKAANEAIVGQIGNELRIRLMAPPVDDAANQALIRFLARQLGCPRNAVSLIRGARSRHKTLLLQGVAATEVLARLLGREGPSVLSTGFLNNKKGRL